MPTDNRLTESPPGFFQVRRCRRCFLFNQFFDEHKRNLKENFLNETHVRNEDLLLQAHSDIVRTISDLIGASAQFRSIHLPKATAEQVNGAISVSRDAVVNLLHRHSIPLSMKAIIWNFLIGLHPFDENVKTQYI
jgi:hypothetical protein